MCLTIRTAIACEPAAVRTARSWVHDQLDGLYEHIDPEVVSDAGLAISELVTNCVRADAHELVVTITAHQDGVTVAATDDAEGTPAVQQPGIASPTGRGLQIVDALTEEWGVTPDDGHKTVWGRFALPGSPEPTFACDH